MHLGAHDGRLCRQVRPDGRHHQHAVAGIDQRLHGQHQRVHTAGRHRHAVHTHRRGTRCAYRAAIAGNFFTQLGQAQVVRIKGFAAGQ